MTSCERLTIDVEAVNAGGGDKFHPQTAAEAARALAPMVSEVHTSLSELPDGACGSVVYFQTTLLPNYLAARHFPAQLLSLTGLVPVGSRVSQSTLETASDSRPATTKSLIVAGELSSVERLEALIVGNGIGDKRSQNAFEQLREISEVRLATEREILGAQGHGLETATWEAVLHPRDADSSGSLIETDEATFAKWVAWIEQLGGEVVEEYRRVEAGLTFVPVRLNASQLLEASRFNPLRSLRPMPTLRLLPTALQHSLADSYRPDRAPS